MSAWVSACVCVWVGGSYKRKHKKTEGLGEANSQQ